MSDELKPTLAPCPFCGEERFVGVRWNSNVRRDATQFHVVCATCRTIGSNQKTEAEAIAAWNRRSPVEADLREALRELLSAADAAVSPGGDDVACMLRYGEAEKRARALTQQTQPTKENEG